MEHLEDKAYIFGAIFILANKLQTLGDKFDPRLTIKQWLMLAGISLSESTAPTIVEVAEIIGSSRQNAKKMINLLERDGFVVLQRDKRDARAQRVYLSDSCRAYLAQREEQELVFMDTLFRDLSGEDIDAMVTLIDKLKHNMEAMAAQYEAK